jgi:hypothetical protein
MASRQGTGRFLIRGNDDIGQAGLPSSIQAMFGQYEALSLSTN